MTLNTISGSLLVFSIDFIYFLVCLYEKPLFLKSFFSFPFFFLKILNRNCCELSQGFGMWLEVACEIGIFIFQM